MLRILRYWIWAWCWGVLVALDQLLNAILFGMPDETVSSRAGRNRDKWYWKWLVQLLNSIDPNHCDKAMLSEVNGKHLPPLFRKLKEA